MILLWLILILFYWLIQETKEFYLARTLNKLEKSWKFELDQGQRQGQATLLYWIEQAKSAEAGKETDKQIIEKYWEGW